MADVTALVEKLFKANASAKSKKAAAVKKAASKKLKRPQQLKLQQHQRPLHQRPLQPNKAQKAAAAKAAKKEASKADPEGWTIVESKSKSIKDRHAAPEKSTPEKRTSHIMITYNHRKATMVAHPDTQA